MRTLRPASYTGLDLNRAAVAYCRKRHNLLGVDFVHGDAEKLPFPDQSFDAVINSNPRLPTPIFPFPRRSGARAAPGRPFPVHRSSPPKQHRRVGGGAAGAPMRMLSHEDINAQVVRGLEKNTPRIWI